MKSVGTHILLDSEGQPLNPQIQRVLRQLLPRFRNKFLTLDDEVLVIEILEQTGRSIADVEAAGQVDNLEAFAWKVLSNVATSRLRQPAERLSLATLGPDASEVVLERMTARDGSPEQIEAKIQVDELMAKLTVQERVLIARKQSGCTSREIARELGTSAANVNMLFYRIKQKCREAKNGTKA
jgi:RNA polymerase sigma factor (sigma-70 family)